MSKVKNFAHLFYESKMDTSLNSWNTAAVTNMDAAFAMASGIKSPAVAGWNVENVSTFQATFFNSAFNDASETAACNDIKSLWSRNPNFDAADAVLECDDATPPPTPTPISVLKTNCTTELNLKSSVTDATLTVAFKDSVLKALGEDFSSVDGITFAEAGSIRRSLRSINIDGRSLTVYQGRTRINADYLVTLRSNDAGQDLAEAMARYLNEMNEPNSSTFEAFVDTMSSSGVQLDPSNPSSGTGIAGAPPQPEPQPVNTSSGMSTGAIIGISISSAAVVLLGILVVVIRKKRNGGFVLPSVFRFGGGVAREANQDLAAPQTSSYNSSDEEMSPREQAPDKNFDEFDAFKDSNLEVLRSDVNTALPNAEVMMSQAMTYAFMNSASSEEVYQSSCKLEVNTLGDAWMWEKRTEKKTVEDRRKFMQDVLNKMVMMVRNGIVQSEDAR